MTPSSSELHPDPFRVAHLDCKNIFEVYYSEWPPRVVVCTNCGVPLKLVGLDANTKRLSYRRITT